MTDALGRDIFMIKHPTRIITIFSSNTEIVAALGLTKYIVGIDAYTYYPASIQQIPKIGGRLGFSLDSIIAQQPDLVIMTPARQATHQLLPALEKLHVATIILDGGSIETILNNILLIGHVTCATERAKQVVDNMRQRFDKIRKDHQQLAKPNVVLITGRTGNGLLLVARLKGLQTNAYTADIIIRAGGKLALDEVQTTKLQINQISPEVLLATNPDIILFADTQHSLDELILATNGWQQMKAAQTGFVRLVSRAELLIPGPRVIDGVESLSTIFKEWNQRH